MKGLSRLNIDFGKIVAGMEMGNAVNVAIYLTMAIIIAVVLIGVLFDKQTENNTFIKWFSRSLAANVVMLVAEAAMCFCEGNIEVALLTKLFAAISYCAGYLMAGFFGFCLVEFINESAKKISYAYAYTIFSVAVILSVIVTIGIFGESLLYVDNAGILEYSKGYILVDIVNVLVFSSEVVFVFFYKRFFGKKAYVLSLFGVLSVVAMPLTLLWDTVPLYAAVSVSLLIMNNIFRNEVSNKLLENERKIAESRVTNLITQIQPHFIFNTLNTIKFLCKTDAALARKTIDSYSVFLRGIIESAASERFVTLSRELEITEHYVFIEKQRFGDILTLNTDIQEKDFFLPMLTLQPIVENAVKHGIRKKADKGTITISTYADADKNYIKISDDGVGFDVHSCELTDGKHVGIQNVSDRIHLMTNGSLEIDSTPGVGTTVLISIPKNAGK